MAMSSSSSRERDGGEETPLFDRAALSMDEGSSTDEELGCYQSTRSPTTESSTKIQDASSPRDHRHRGKRGGPARESLTYHELRGMVSLAVPVVSTYLLEMLPGLVSIVLVGHVHHAQTEEFIDATALAVMFMNLTGMSIGIGLATAMDTLCSQAYGAEQTERMGIYFQTGLEVLGVFSLCISVTFYYASDILMSLGQPVKVSQLAGEAVWVLLPGVPGVFLYELLRKVLQAQNIAAPMFYVCAAANVINGGVGYYLVYHSRYGWLGASMARSICNISLFLILFPYVILSGQTRTFWTGWRPREAFEGIPAFLALGVPGCLQVCFEWWAFEVLGLLCGRLPDAVVAIGANAVIMNSSSMVYMLYLGISISGNVRIGNSLGAGDPERARVAALVTLGLCGLMALLCAAFLLTFRNVLPLLFTHDQIIDELSTSLLCIASLFQIPDAINGAVQGVFRGSGRQNLGAWLNFISYYLLGIPLGAVLAFALSYGVVGLWCGMTLGLSFIAICGTALVVRSDWVKLSDDAKRRVHSAKSWSNLLDAS